MSNYSAETCYPIDEFVTTNPSQCLIGANLLFRLDVQAPLRGWQL